MQTKPKVKELRQCVWRSDAKLIMVLFTDHCGKCSINNGVECDSMHKNYEHKKQSMDNIASVW